MLAKNQLRSQRNSSLKNQPCKSSPVLVPTRDTCCLFQFFQTLGVTDHKKAASNDNSLPSQNQPTFRARLLQLQIDNDAARAELATSTAELTARIAELAATAAEADAQTAVARRTTKPAGDRHGHLRALSNSVGAHWDA